MAMNHGVLESRPRTPGAVRPPPLPSGRPPAPRHRPHISLFDERGREVTAHSAVPATSAEETEVAAPSRALFLTGGVAAALAVVGGLYLGGWVGKPELAASPEPAAFAAGFAALDEAISAEALANARVAVRLPSIPTLPVNSLPVAPSASTPAALDDSAAAAPTPAPENQSDNPYGRRAASQTAPTSDSPY